MNFWSVLANDLESFRCAKTDGVGTWCQVVGEAGGYECGSPKVHPPLQCQGQTKHQELPVVKCAGVNNCFDLHRDEI